MLFVGLVACLPALRRFVPLSPEAKERCKTAPGFAYRKLTRVDFQAAESLAQPEDLKDSRGAWCIRLNTDEAAAAIKGVPRLTVEGTRYAASLEDVVVKEEFVPGCSWLSPELDDDELSRFLEDARIHFALAAIFARTQTCAIRELAVSDLPLAATADEAIVLARHRVEADIQRGLERLYARQARYDRDSYMYGVTWNDRRWSKKVDEELADLEMACSYSK